MNQGMVEVHPLTIRTFGITTGIVITCVIITTDAFKEWDNKNAKCNYVCAVPFQQALVYYNSRNFSIN